MTDHPLSPYASTVLILGMHRSGTSCLAGSLQEAGLYLGEVNTAAPHNAKGNRESRDCKFSCDEGQHSPYPATPALDHRKIYRRKKHEV